VTDTDRVRDRILADHAMALAATVEAAEVVANSRNGPAIHREEVVEPLTAVLERVGVIEQYPEIITTAVDTLGESLPASLVVGPPYVTITATGPVLRASLPSGRLVIRLAVFTVERNPKRYVRRGETPEEILEIERR
jgi:hypothetical protein